MSPLLLAHEMADLEQGARTDIEADFRRRYGPEESWHPWQFRAYASRTQLVHAVFHADGEVAA